MMLKLLIVAVGALLISAFFKYTVLIHQRWAEEEGERLGLNARHEGVATILSGIYHGIPVRLVLRGRKLHEGEARLMPGKERSEAEFRQARQVFGSAHFKRDGVWASFPRAAAGDSLDDYLEALSTAAEYAARHSPDELFELDVVS